MNCNRYIKNNLSKLLVIILLMVTMSGCWDKQETHSIFDEYLVMGKTEQIYLGEVANLLELVYSETSDENRSNLEYICNKYMTQECTDYMLGEKNWDSITKIEADARVTHINFGYANHQEDNKDTILAHLKIESEEVLMVLALEMRLNQDDLIYEIVVW